MARKRFLLDLKKILGGTDFFRWIGFGVVVGIISGLGAVAFIYLLEWLKFFALKELAGYQFTHPVGEHIVNLTSHTPLRRWVLFFVPAVGGLICGLIVYTFVPEAEGDGTNAMVDAFHNKGGFIRGRVPILKGITSIITLGTGGSAGREGPISQIGAGFGSFVAQKLKLSPREHRILVLAGTAGGLGAIFRAPLGAALTAVEVIYSEDFESEAIVPAVISSVVAYSLFTFVYGHQPIFFIPKVVSRNPVELIFYGILGLACVPLGMIYVRMFLGARDQFFVRFPVRPYFRPMLGGLMVGAIAMIVPQVMSGGYGTMQEAVLAQIPLKLLILCCIFKTVATSITLPSGSSGGVFGPTLFIGAMLGGIVGALGHTYFPQLVMQPGNYAVVGMAAFFAGVAHAPIGALMMVCEMTGGYDLLAPLMFSCAISSVLLHRYSIYDKQVMNKFASPAHIGDATVNVLQELQVRDIFNPHRVFTLIPNDMTLHNVQKLFATTTESFYPVVDDEFRYLGMISAVKIRSYVYDEDLTDFLLVEDFLERSPSLDLDDDLFETLSEFLDSGFGSLPVVDRQSGGEMVGVLDLEELMEAYHNEVFRRKGDS